MINQEKLTWSNIDKIVENLIDEHNELQDIEYISALSFIKLKEMICLLEAFDDNGSCNERKLEAIQQKLIEAIE